jgi:hypothetical protein
MSFARLFEICKELIEGLTLVGAIALASVDGARSSNVGSSTSFCFKRYSKHTEYATFFNARSRSHRCLCMVIHHPFSVPVLPSVDEPCLKRK